MGNSTWEIFTPSGGTVDLGGKKPPEWLRLTTETDKDVYRQGEPVVIKPSLENGGTEAVKLDDMRLVIDIGNATILPDPGSTTTALHILYSIDAILPSYSSENETAATTLGSRTKVLLARPFYWDQGLAGSVTSEPVIETIPLSVEPGNYTIRTSFAGYNGAVIYDSKNIQIVAAAYDNDSNMLSKPEVWAYGDMQYPLMIGAGAAAVMIAFLTLRKNK